MAEFAEVMRQAKRMCDATVGGKCNECTLWRPETESCSLYGDDDGVDYADMERRVMAWAAEHPAQRYPTWYEWLDSTFPNRSREPSPCEFDDKRRFNCVSIKCYECMNKPIPADTAEKLGIKPITTEKVVPAHDGCESCRWMYKDEDEEPCKNCCGVRGGSAPDLWEEG